jgi:hypothetical protein
VVKRGALIWKNSHRFADNFGKIAQDVFISSESERRFGSREPIPSCLRLRRLPLRERHP